MTWGGTRGCQERGLRAQGRELAPRTGEEGSLTRTKPGSQTLGCGTRPPGWLSGEGGATTGPEPRSTSSHSRSPPAAHGLSHELRLPATRSARQPRLCPALPRLTRLLSPRPGTAPGAPPGPVHVNTARPLAGERGVRRALHPPPLRPAAREIGHRRLPRRLPRGVGTATLNAWCKDGFQTLGLRRRPCMPWESLPQTRCPPPPPGGPIELTCAGSGPLLASPPDTQARPNHLSPPPTMPPYTVRPSRRPFPLSDWKTPTHPSKPS